MQSLLWVSGGTGFIFLMTCFGSAMVFVFRNQTGRLIQTIFLGFAAGIMISASVFGLLVPAIETAES
ncbi:MAG: ZIP family metal transporter, partial [Treponema sp.]|nr:ZIP family metal transporter [Treponema sp.]